MQSVYKVTARQRDRFSEWLLKYVYNAYTVLVSELPYAKAEITLIFKGKDVYKIIKNKD